jgi:hypothetical protein
MTNSLSASERQDLARKLAADELEEQLTEKLLEDAQVLAEEWHSLDPKSQVRRLETLMARARHLPPPQRLVVGGLLGRHRICSRKEFEALLEDQEKTDPSAEQADIPKNNGRPTFAATLPALVNLVLAEDGTPAFAILKSDGSGIEVVKEWVGLDEKPLKPPPIEAIPFELIPGEMIAGPLQKPDPGELAAEVEAALRNAAILPTDRHYRFLVIWVLATHLVERASYFTGLLFLGPPERGKSRMLRALAALSHRGWRTETLNEAGLFRFCERFEGTLFLDLYDVMSKLERTGALDILLALPERGVKVARVVRPDAPAFQDMQYYQPFAPCAMALNRPIPQGHPLRTRFVEITMPEARGQRFDDLDPARVRRLKAKLLRWRAQWLFEPLPEVEKLCDGRLGDLTQVLARVAAVLPEEYGRALRSLIEDLLIARAEAERESFEGQLVQAIHELEGRVTNGRLPIHAIAEQLNAHLEDGERPATARYVGRVLRTLGIPKARDAGRRYMVWKPKVLEPLFRRYLSIGPTEVSDEIRATPPEEIRHIRHFVTDKAQVIERTSTFGDDESMTNSNPPRHFVTQFVTDLSAGNHSQKRPESDEMTIMTNSPQESSRHIPAKGSGVEVPDDADPGYIQALLQDEPPPEGFEQEEGLLDGLPSQKEVFV